MIWVTFVLTEQEIYFAGQIRVGGDFPAAVARFDAGSEFRWLNSFDLTRMVDRRYPCNRNVRRYRFVLLTVNFTGFASMLYCDTAGHFTVK
ncbi:MAG: hypothetical protein IPF75_07575 [Bacteroidetes bacterium]|nr:hypothetical protein [Bacteroidota bacterium]